MCVGRERTYEEAVKEIAGEVREFVANKGVALIDVVNELATAVIVENE